MNSQISYGLGLFQGDGCFGINKKKKVLKDGTLKMYKNPYINFSSTDLYLVEFFKNIFKIDSKIVTSIDKRKTTYKPYYRVQTYNKDLINFMKKCGLGFYKELNIDSLLNSIEGFEWSFIRGLLDTDGTVSKNTKTGYLEIFTNDLQVGFWLETFCLKNNLKSSLYVYNKGRAMTLYGVRVPKKEIKRIYNNLFEYKAPYVSRKHERVNKLINC